MYYFVMKYEHDGLVDEGKGRNPHRFSKKNKRFLNKNEKIDNNHSTCHTKNATTDAVKWLRKIERDILLLSSPRELRFWKTVTRLSETVANVWRAANICLVFGGTTHTHESIMAYSSVCARARVYAACVCVFV